MIGIVFQRLDEVLEIRVDGRVILFRTNTHPNFMPIDSLRLDRLGVIKEFPDLKDSDEWRQMAIIRFKEKINSMRNEDEIKNYLIEDLRLYGYVAKAYQRQGYRVEKIGEDDE